METLTMNMQESYFSFTSAYSPLPMLARWLNPYKNRKMVKVKGFSIDIEWTQRAENQLRKMKTALTVEMQIYFSCVVKKRVLFHENDATTGPEATEVTDKLSIGFNVVESNSCDPVEFASNFPVKNRFESVAASRMHPKKVSIDFSKGSWNGEFTI